MKVTENLFDVFESMKHRIDILKAVITERRDQKMERNIRNATLKLDEMFARTISSVRAKSGCNI